MAKQRAASRFGPDSTDKIVDSLIEIAGPLPMRTFKTLRPTRDGRAEPVTLTAREYLSLRLVRAATAFGARTTTEPERTPTQLAAQFEAIRAASRDLLLALQVGLEKPDLDKMPEDIRYGGLQAMAALVAPSTRAASGEALLREAVKGVGRLHNWSRVAMQRERSALPAVTTCSQNQNRARHHGNVDLNRFCSEVVLNLWLFIFGHEIAVGPKLVKFVKAAGRAINARLGDDDAVAKRLQRLHLHHEFPLSEPTEDDVAFFEGVGQIKPN